MDTRRNAYVGTFDSSRGAKFMEVKWKHLVNVNGNFKQMRVIQAADQNAWNALLGLLEKLEVVYEYDFWTSPTMMQLDDKF